LAVGADRKSRSAALAPQHTVEAWESLLNQSKFLAAPPILNRRQHDTAADGVSALFYAIIRGDLETVTALVELGADVNQPVWSDQSGSPLWFAQDFWGMLEIADFLRERGAAYFSEEIDA
jgi:ankyrin repeat protein